MITAIVRFGLDIAPEQWKKMCVDSMPRYKAVKGLIRKYYLLSEDGKTGGGVYLWNSRADADRLYTDEWKERIRGMTGHAPSISFFETPAIVDNKTGETSAEAA